MKSTIRKIMPDLLSGGGAICISIGAFLLWVPVGFIVAGVLLITTAVIWSRGGGTE